MGLRGCRRQRGGLVYEGDGEQGESRGVRRWQRRVCELKQIVSMVRVPVDGSRAARW